MSPLALQTAVFQTLQSPLDGLLADMVTPSGTTLSQPAIYDHVPQTVDSDDQFPYVVVGDDTNNPFDTDTSLGSDSTITIHVWSRFRGRSETKEIQKAIYESLHRAELSVGDRHTVDVIWEFAQTILDQDGITRHGVMRFRVITEEV